ncbi:single-stranded DNA-binding protein [Nocardioides pacificus]
MSTQEAAVEAAAGFNEVRLIGRVSQVPERRELPSGDELWTFRVIVPRPVTRSGQARGPAVDTLDCAAWSGRARRSVAGWSAGDVVEVTGPVRRRFFRTGAGAASRVEVEVVTARRLRRAPTS